jgi:ketosteroid isomerase-like protein
MKYIIRTLALAAVAACLALFQSSAKAQDAGNADVEKMIARMEDDWAAALLNADLAAVDRIEAPDYTIADQDGNLMTRAQSDAELKAGDYKATAFKNDEVKVRVYGDTAIVSGLETETSTYKGKDSSGQYRFTDVFVKRDGIWQAVATHTSKVAKM